MDADKIAKRLVELRGDRSRAEIAQKIGVSVSAMQMYENGERIPRDETKKKIAELFGKTVQQIFFD